MHCRWVAVLDLLSGYTRKISPGVGGGGVGSEGWALGWVHFWSRSVVGKWDPSFTFAVEMRG